MKKPLSLLLLLLCCSSAVFARKQPKPKPPVEPVVAEVNSPPSNPFARTDRVSLFESTVTVKQDGTLHVVENITIYNGDGDMGLDEFPMQYIEAGGNNNDIHRGILRSFPTVYVNRYHFFQNTTFKLLDVKMNGAAVPYETEHSLNSNGYRVKIGDRDKELDTGSYTYTLVYETEHQVKYFDRYDELAWNVTGNGWSFRIDSAVCTFIIPGNDSVFSNACYTGGQYERGQDCRVNQAGTDTIRFTTTKALWPNQGITVATSWRKGIIARPGMLRQAWWMFTANIGALGMPLLLVLIFLYNLVQWWRYGRDLKPGTIYPRYEPPTGFSPAALGYIYFQGMKDKLVAATITDLALRHFFLIEVERTGTVFKGTVYSFHKSKEPFIAAVYNDYHKEANSLIYTNIQRGQYNESLAELNTAIKEDLNEHYRSSKRKPGKGLFFRNSQYLAFGFLLAVPAFAGLMIWSLAHASLSPWPLLPLIVSFILVIVMQYIFYKLFPAYTPEGRKLMDELEGYRMYLKTVDEARLNTMNPPDKTIDLFEKNLPFAIALNCDIEWGDKFEGIIAAAAIDDTVTTRAFYMSDTGHGFTGSAFASGLSSSISSASTPPSSSSDSSSGSSSSFGGGSSGSGGGGGGGGGW
ncbi:DUF2207 domain-containing protein [Taibaiella chishuiensis]|uniref:Putative membrane protein DUF2207 n=1 Tax=Taibaiella chishuiensis TaxID=1434707 RepID=A0A2P8DAB6_9BACT|nr:DUF2207 domain-containing protein [Taibaiella chishuiensis]PSK94121.1 putative membrane protein DUF2207 [Taibaiella chishuiensis]